jgi:PAS domain S-box-containing protein
MEKMVLFVDRRHDLSREAERTAAQAGDGAVHWRSIGVDNDNADVSFSSLLSTPFDCVVAIGKEAGERCALLSGLPAVIRWDDLDPAAGADFDETVKEVQRRVRELVCNGCMQALLMQHSHLANVVDSLQEGVIVHDLNRRVFLFSKGAERITGTQAGMVLGRDCHDLFRPRLCGAECAYCDGESRQESAHSVSAYGTRFIAPDGTGRDLAVKRTSLVDEQGKVVGVLATFTDTTKIHDLELRLAETESFSGIIGRDHQMREVFQLIRDLSGSDFPVVITGESGTGKELVAAAIHNESQRRDNLFVPVNCGALPEGTLESELFGHVKGSFTGAIRDKKGRFELADGGTLFLDEIGDLSLPMQVKLLRVLQEGVFEPVGSEKSCRVDVRVICATNRNLREMAARGTFREDLFYRLAVVPIEMPPLRERRNDIPLLASHFLEKTTGKLARGQMSFSDDTLAVLMNYSWPGNVRQLQNAIQFALIKCRSAIIMPEHLPPEILSSTYVPTGVPKTPGKVGRRPKLTREVVERALEKAGGNKAKAARFLGVGRATLYNFINSHETVEV